MIPAFAGDNPVNMRGADPELLRDGYGTSASTVQHADLSCLIFGKLRASTLLAFGALVVSLATLYDHIVHVFGLRAQEQMSRIDTCRIIAPMQHIHSVWNGAVGKFVAKAVRGHFFVPNAELSVSLPIGISKPEPTIGGTALIHLCPESLLARRSGRLGVMTSKKFEGLTDDVAALGIILSGYVCWLAAATFTELWGVVCGILLHSNVSLLDLLKPADDSTRRAGNYFATPIIARMWGVF